MSRSVEEITKSEAELIERLESVSGLMEVKTEQLKTNGVFDGFAQIYREYAASDDLEATKRAIFYFWYQASEPDCFSGLGDLPKELNELVLEKLGRLVSEGRVDVELKWMLPYYYTITDWLFDSIYSTSKGLKDVLTHHGDRWYFELKPEAFVNRGLMGRYWGSMHPKIGQRLHDSEAKS